MGGERFVRVTDALAYSEEDRATLWESHAEASPHRHLQLDALQRQLVRRLLALAEAVNATPILPQLHCACEQSWWLLKRCRHPLAPASMHLPFACPQDTAYDVARWHQEGLAFREAGFVDNPRLPEAVRRNAVRLIVQKRAGGASQRAAARVLSATLLTGTPMVEVLPLVLRANPHARLVEVAAADLAALSPWLGSVEANSRFERRARKLLSHSMTFCTEEANPAFPGWSQWERSQRQPPLNCTKAALYDALPPWPTAVQDAFAEVHHDGPRNRITNA